MQRLFPRLIVSLFTGLCLAAYAAWSGGGIWICLGAFWLGSNAVFLFFALWSLVMVGRAVSEAEPKSERQRPR